MDTTKLGLGTVQFGLDYGISNKAGQVAGDTVDNILGYARRVGIEVLDTAAAYGDSEAVLGANRAAEQGFRIVTKIPPDVDPNDLPALVRASLQRLDTERVYGLLAHRSSDLLGMNGGVVWQQMEALRERGLVERIGVSVYTGEEIDRLLERFPLEIVQLPINLFDQRLIQGGQLQRLHAAGVEIHARSVFLQGLILMDPEQLPPGLSAAVGPLTCLREALAGYALTALQAALRFVLQRTEIDTVLVGVTSEEQFRQIVEAARQPLLPTGFDSGQWAIDDPMILNPSLWPTG